MAPAVNVANRTSVVNGKMVLDEYVPDMRWRRGYTEIVIRDLATGRTRRLTHRTRFMNPVLSPDGKRVAVVEFLPDRSCSLVILDAGTGGELRRLPSPGNDMIYMPAWSGDGRRVVMVAQGKGGRGIRVADLQAGSFQDAIPPGLEDLANPVLYRDYVLYRTSPRPTGWHGVTRSRPGDSGGRGAVPPRHVVRGVAASRVAPHDAAQGPMIAGMAAIMLAGALENPGRLKHANLFIMGYGSVMALAL
jgi:hypothetical protein